MAAKSARNSILDTALELAEQKSWERVRLHDVAAKLQIGLNDIRVHFPEKEALIDAWFDRADAAMLQEAAKADFPALSARERLRRLILIWLKALAAHRRVTCQMISGKFEPGHLHYQYAGLLRISRTVQWLREAAGRDTALPWRALEEVALTAIYLAAFLYWMQDNSEGTVRTATFLDNLLTRTERTARWIPGFPRPQ